jgi:tetratricopeptide (TPR) repeat protein
MSARRTELLVVGGLVLGMILLGYLQLHTKAADEAANDAVGRGNLVEAAELGRECASADGGLLELNDRLICIAHLADNESTIGRNDDARARLDLAFAEADREGLAVTAEARAALLISSSFVARDVDPPRSIRDARAGLALAATPSQRAIANARLGSALKGPEALQLLRTARAQFIALEGPHAMNVALTEISLGGELMSTDPKEAIAVLEAAAESYGMAGDGGHPFQGIALGALSRARYDQEDLEGAEADLRKAIPIIRAGLGPSSPFLHSRLCDLGELLFETDRDTEALPLLEEGTRLASIVNDESMRCRNDYGAVLFRVGKKAEAHEVLVRLLEDAKALPASELAIEDITRTLARVESDGAVKH